MICCVGRCAIPTLAQRASEFDRLLQAALDDAAEALRTWRVRLAPRMRQSVFEQVASFAELEKTALRLVALASARNPTQAALRLQMAPVSLIRWLRRRSWPMTIRRDLELCSFGTDQ